MAEEAKPEAPKKSKKRLIIVLVTVVLLAGAGGGAWFFLQGKKDDPQAAADEHRKKEKKSRTFVNLDPFTVNLADEDDRFAQVAVVLEVSDNEIGEEIKAMTPAVRNKILLLLSSKRSKELLSVNGKELLASQIADATARVIGWQPAAPQKLKVKAKRAKDEDAEDEDDESPAKTANGENEADGDDDTPRSKGKSKTKVAPNPVEKVHFAQFIIQ
jgi:flagellar protein FliL